MCSKVRVANFFKNSHFKISLERENGDFGSRRCYSAVELQLSLLNSSLDQFVQGPDVVRFSDSSLAFQLRWYQGVLETSDLD